MFRHVLCVYPYRLECGTRDGMYPPLGLEIIAAALEPYSEAIDIVDLRLETGRTTDFLRPDTDLVCFSVNWDRERDFVRGEIRSVPEHIRTFVGGRFATMEPEIWLADCPDVDILVRGDGEETVDEIARGIPLDKVTGISYRLDGRFAHNAVRRYGPVRDDLYPDRRLRRYVYEVNPLGPGRGLPYDTVASSRGCPFNCRFCSFNRNPWGTKRDWSARSPESVVRELEEIDQRIVLFVDDNFTHDMDRVGAICDLIMERGIRKRYVVNARLEISRRPDVLRKMERAGFSGLALGIESAQDRTLRSMRKGFNTRQAREHFRVLKRSRMLLVGYFIVGNIGETEEEMLAIAPFARELGLDALALCLLRNDPYTGLEELVAETPGYHIAPNGFIYSDTYPVSHLSWVRRQINRKFYTPGSLLRTLSKGYWNRLITPSMLAGLPGFVLRKALKWSRRRRPANGEHGGRMTRQGGRMKDEG